MFSSLVCAKNHPEFAAPAREETFAADGDVLAAAGDAGPGVRGADPGRAPSGLPPPPGVPLPPRDTR